MEGCVTWPLLKSRSIFLIHDWGSTTDPWSLRVMSLCSSSFHVNANNQT
jgi:hypothetical protein